MTVYAGCVTHRGIGNTNADRQRADKKQKLFHYYVAYDIKKRATRQRIFTVFSNKKSRVRGMDYFAAAT